MQIFLFEFTTSSGRVRVVSLGCHHIPTEIYYLSLNEMRSRLAKNRQGLPVDHRHTEQWVEARLYSNENILLSFGVHMDHCHILCLWSCSVSYKKSIFISKSPFSSDFYPVEGPLQLCHFLFKIELRKIVPWVRENSSDNSIWVRPSRVTTFLAVFKNSNDNCLLKHTQQT